LLSNWWSHGRSCRQHCNFRHTASGCFVCWLLSSPFDLIHASWLCEMCCAQFHLSARSRPASCPAKSCIECSTSLGQLSSWRTPHGINHAPQSSYLPTKAYEKEYPPSRVPFCQ
jgi:hypothetical protein